MGISGSKTVFSCSITRSRSKGPEAATSPSGVSPMSPRVRTSSAEIRAKYPLSVWTVTVPPRACTTRTWSPARSDIVWPLGISVASQSCTSSKGVRRPVFTTYYQFYSRPLSPPRRSLGARHRHRQGQGHGDYELALGAHCSLERSLVREAVDRESFSEQRFDVGAKRLGPDSIEHLARERLSEQRPRRLAGHSARAQIEQDFLIEGTYRGAVGALHVVGEDLESRPSIDLAVLREQQVHVGLVSVRTVSARPDDDPTIEHTVAAAVHDPLVELVADTTRCDVLNENNVVVVLISARPVQTVDADP